MNNTVEIIEKHPEDGIYYLGSANIRLKNRNHRVKQMKLIREEIETVEFLVEQKNGKKSMYIEGVFLQGNIKNRNGRMYPMETLRREVSRYNENHVVSW